MSESAQREIVFDGLETRNQRRLRVLREAMALLYRSRLVEYGEEVAYVCADDVRRWLRDHPQYDTPGNRNWLAAVWRSKEWKRLAGTHESCTAGSHGNDLARWGLRP